VSRPLSVSLPLGFNQAQTLVMLNQKQHKRLGKNLYNLRKP